MFAHWCIVPKSDADLTLWFNGSFIQTSTAGRHREGKPIPYRTIREYGDCVFVL